MDAALERLVKDRSRGRCEYRLLPRRDAAVPFEMDHIIARKHGGRTVASNRAMSCEYCNAYKGPNLAGLDPATGRLTRLFHPRRHSWSRHYRYNRGLLVGRTAIGRTTVEVLQINRPSAVALRAILTDDGTF